jgi:hypothetical protein
LVAFSAFYIAGCAAFYSIFGLSKLFAGASLAVIIMAGSLEIGKLIGASFLYRYWKKINFLMKLYMTTGVVTLVFITSAGIFGFLSNAYQGATIEFEKESATLLYKEDRLNQLEEDKVYLKDELEQSVNTLPDNYPTAKRKLREEYNPKVFALNEQILNIKQEIGDLKVSLVETGVDVGPAIYLARTFNTDIDTVTKFFIFILIFVFDPMAVSLVIAYNVIVIDRQKEIVIRENKKIIMVEEKHNEEKPNYKKKESKSKEIKTPIIVRKNKKKESLTKDNDRLEKGGVIPSS